MARVSINRVLVLLVILTAVAAALPFVNYAPNRLVSGEGRQIWAIWPGSVSVLVGAGCALFTLCFVPGRKGAALTLAVAQLLVILWN